MLRKTILLLSSLFLLTALVASAEAQVVITAGKRVSAGAGAGLGDVVGPAGATANTLACFDGTTGLLIKECTGLSLPATTSSSAGILFQDSVRLLHSYNAGGVTLNLFLGYSSGNFDLTASVSNTGLGTSTLYSLTEGSQNTAVGHHALFSDTTGNNNTGIGYQSLYTNSTGSSNTAVGYNTLRLNTASSNTAVGFGVLATTTGAGNTAIGVGSLSLVTTGTYNTAIGYGSGLALTTGGSSVLIGSFAGHYETAGSSFYIDNQDRTDIAGGKVGALLYGTFSSTAANQTLVTNAILSINAGLTTGGAVLQLGTKEPSVVANDILGRINFIAPVDTAGTDANLAGASIAAIAEGSFSASSNATSLLFQTGASETATTKLTITSAGLATFTGAVVAPSFTPTYFPHTAAGSTETVDWTTGSSQRVILDENLTITLTNPVNGARYLIVFVQDSNGTNTVTWADEANIYWNDGGTPPVITATANTISLCTLVYDGTLSKYLGACSLDHK